MKTLSVLLTFVLVTGAHLLAQRVHVTAEPARVSHSVTSASVQVAATFALGQVTNVSTIQIQ